jgi:hypothetical protein
VCLGLKLRAISSIGSNTSLSFSSIDTAYQAIRSGVSRNTGLPLAKEIKMTVQKQIKEYIAAQPEPKRSEMGELHDILRALMPKGKLWFLDGKDAKGKIVSNPNIGYGSQSIKYANGKTKEFYQIGVSANTTGISVYILGIDDKKYLAHTFGRDLGKASVTGYCIKFKTLADVKVDVLRAAILHGIGQTSIQH